MMRRPIGKAASDVMSEKNSDHYVVVPRDAKH
jgi:hypothetical protein